MWNHSRKGTLQNPGLYHYIWQHVATAEPPVCTIGHGEQSEKASVRWTGGQFPFAPLDTGSSPKSNSITYCKYGTYKQSKISGDDSNPFARSIFLPLFSSGNPQKGIFAPFGRLKVGSILSPPLLQSPKTNFLFGPIGKLCSRLRVGAKPCRSLDLRPPGALQIN